MEAPQNQVTLLLQEWRGGDGAALDRLMPLVYDELRGVAQKRMGLGGEYTLQATALVNEAYLRLVNIDVEWQDRAHFFALAAGMMRKILVDEVRRRGAKKRGGPEEPATLVEVADDGRPVEDLLRLGHAITQLQGVDPRKAKVLELRYFGGLTIEETAEALEISHATVERDLRSAKAWVISQLRGAGSAVNR
ncbi:MAG: sigma-70 family RNA polymerase sigma factor [Acidobacteriota bacterium]